MFATSSLCADARRACYVPTGSASVNGEKVAEGRIEKRVPFLFSAGETADVGLGNATPVTEEYMERDNEFTGKIEKVTVEVKKAVRPKEVPPQSKREKTNDTNDQPSGSNAV